MKKNKKSKLKKISWLAGVLSAVGVGVFLLLLHKPAYFEQQAQAENKHISQYVSNVFLPYIHNNAQLGKGFDVVISQSRTEDFIALVDWPQHLDDISFLKPAVFFAADSMVLAGTGVVKGVEFVVTVVLEPQWSENGLLNLHIATVKIGAVNVTALVKLVTRNIYSQKFASRKADADDIGPKLVASLLADKSFEPVFEIKGNNVRIEKISITPQKLNAWLVPSVQ